jgi:hypothetical protein
MFMRRAFAGYSYHILCLIAHRRNSPVWQLSIRPEFQNAKSYQK